MMWLSASASAFLAFALSTEQFADEANLQEYASEDTVYALREITGPTTAAGEDIKPRLIFPIAPAFSMFAQCDSEKPHKVEMAFDVFPDGKTANIRVLSATDECFVRAATRAMERWKYVPIEVEGTAITITGVEGAITFHAE